MQFFCLYVLSLLIGALGAWGMMKYGIKLGVTDIPNHRSSHLKETPKCGGIGILLVILVVSICVPIPIFFWLPSLIIAIVSFWGGDKRFSPPKTRLFIQFICSVIFLIFGGFFDMGSFSSILFCGLLSLFIVGTSNFYNFMDGIDGIAGITGVIGFSLLAFHSYGRCINVPYGVLSLAVSFACLGFLFFNIPKARVFLGDIGSVLLGFMFACMVVILSKSVTDFMVMIGFLAPFYFDEIFTMAIRIRNGDSLIKPHRKHIYQRSVNELSLSHLKVSLLYGAVQLLIGLTAIFVSSNGLSYLVLLYVIYGFVFAFISIKINNKVKSLHEN